MSIILSLDCSGTTASICLRHQDETLYEEMLNTGLTHSETLLELIARGLNAENLQIKDLGAIALTVGPGSFTGLRIGLSLVKGLVLPQQLPVIAVSTLEAMARSTHPSSIVISAINARRKEVYWAAFRRGSSFERLTLDAAAPATEATVFYKKQKESVFWVGDGANLCYNEDGYAIESSFVECTPFVARGVAEAATEYFANGCATTAANLVPQYLRLSQAERERLQKQSVSKQIIT